MMTLEKMKLAVCEKLPELIEAFEGVNRPNLYQWIKPRPYRHPTERSINWPTEGLQVCHEAEKLLTLEQCTVYDALLYNLPDSGKEIADACTWHATYEQRLEALCRVWFPERFTNE